VRKINGIGPKSEVKLRKLHLHTIGDIASQSRDWLVDNFGQAYGAWMHDAAWGRDDRPVVTESEPVSMSRETTFDRDLHAVRDRAALGAIFTGAVRAGRGRPAAQGLCRPHHRHQAALRRFPHRHARPDAGPLHRRCAHHPPRGRPMPEAGRPGPRLRLLGVRVGKLAKADAPEAGMSYATPEPTAASRAEERTLDLF
jgi:DNA polymerase-4